MVTASGALARGCAGVAAKAEEEERREAVRGWLLAVRARAPPSSRCVKEARGMKRKSHIKTAASRIARHQMAHRRRVAWRRERRRGAKI